MTFPYGYAGSPQGMGTQLTIAQYETMTTVRKLNFEFWRRTKALMEYAATQGVPLGVGTGWRIQPSNPGPGFAQPGNSNHEGFPADGVSGGAVAADMVPSTSWGWMQSKLPLWGLRSFQFVNNEPWHIQPLEIPASRSFRKEPWVLQVWPLPGQQPPPPPPACRPPYNPETHDYGLYPFNQSKPALGPGFGYTNGTQQFQGFCEYANWVMRVEAGKTILPCEERVWTIHSMAGCQDIQRFFGLPISGWMTMETWGVIDGLATNFGRPR